MTSRPIPLQASGLNFEVAVAGEKLGNGASNQPISIPAKGEGQVQLQVRTSLAAWIRQLANWQQLPGGKLDYVVHGQLQGLNGVADLPFESKGQWALPALKK